MLRPLDPGPDPSSDSNCHWIEWSNRSICPRIELSSFLVGSFDKIGGHSFSACALLDHTTNRTQSAAVDTAWSHDQFRHTGSILVAAA